MEFFLFSLKKNQGILEFTRETDAAVKKDLTNDQMLHSSYKSGFQNESACF